MLARLGRNITQADWVKELKRVSNLWLKNEYRMRGFEWQGGYADFSVSESNLDQVKRTSPIRRSIIGNSISRMNYASCCGAIMLSGMKDIFGNDATALRLCARILLTQRSRCRVNVGLEDLTALPLKDHA